MVILLGACTERNPDFCETDADCRNAAAPFCDVNGEFPESGKIKNACSATPADCPLERCGCTPGEALSCDLDQLTVCAPDAHSTATVTCGLGCSTEDRCLTFEPSNGLGPALELAAAEPDVVLPASIHIDSDLGAVRDANGATIPVTSIVVAQSGAPSIRVFMGRSFEIDDALVEGSFAVAFVAPGSIALKGKLDASAQGRQNGPGAQEAPALCVGASTREVQNGSFVVSGGAGGAGDAVTGARGGSYGTSVPAAAGGAGGATIPGLAPLIGGCRGGSLTRLGGAVTPGGGGGGAIQLVSLDEIALINSGLIDLGGGGGEAGGGGGSGGLAILEAPRVRLEGAAAGFASNGGAGGGCAQTGSDGLSNSSPAPGPKCTNASAGDGGAGSVLPGAGTNFCADSGSGCLVAGALGGGGGAGGRIHIATHDGAFVSSGTPILSAVISRATITPR
jgi:hypothetical protein